MELFTNGLWVIMFWLLLQWPHFTRASETQVTHQGASRVVMSQLGINSFLRIFWPLRFFFSGEIESPSAIERFIINSVSDHSRPVSHFTAVSFCVAANGKKSFWSEWGL